MLGGGKALRHMILGRIPGIKRTPLHNSTVLVSSRSRESHKFTPDRDEA